MKKNLMIVMFLVSVVLVASLMVVSAGITGYLFRGDSIPGTFTQIESVGSNFIVVDGENVEIGETFVSSSNTYKVVAVETPSWFLGRPKVAIQEITAPVPVVSQTATDCEENCQGITESYKLDEGETLNISGDQISIDFINANQVKLDINGQITDSISKDQWVELSNGQILFVQSVHRLEVGGEIGYVKLGVGSYKLDEGETLNINGNTLSINYIDATSTILNINGQNTDSISKYQWVELNNGQIMVVEKVAKLEVGGTIGYVKLGFSSCYFMD